MKPSLPGQDHVRAAMTCIHFFTHGASSYLQLGEKQVDLCSRQQFFTVATTSCQKRRLHSSAALVGPRQRAPEDVPAGAAGSDWRKEEVSGQFVQEDDVVERRVQVILKYFYLGFILVSNLSKRLFVSTLHISCFCSIRHMNTIELQLEVTRFLHRCETAASAKSSQASTASSKSGSPPTLFGGSPMKVDVACRVRFSGFYWSLGSIGLSPVFFCVYYGCENFVFHVYAGDARREKHRGGFRHCLSSNPGRFSSPSFYKSSAASNICQISSRPEPSCGSDYEYESLHHYMSPETCLQLNRLLLHMSAR